MVEIAPHAPHVSTEAPRGEQTASFLDSMRASVTQFTHDVSKANERARSELGRTAVGHMLAGLAPLASGIIGEAVLGELLTKIGERVEGQRGGKATPLSLLTDIVRALEQRPVLKEIAKNVGVTVAYNQLVAKPSEGALPPASATDTGIAVGLDAAAIAAERLAGSERMKPMVDHLPRTVKEGGKHVIEGVKLANGPTVLGIRMIVEGASELTRNWRAIQFTRNHPREPNPYMRPQQKPWEREERPRGGNREKTYYGQGRGRDDTRYDRHRP